MKKVKYVFALICLLTVSIYCSKSNDIRPLSKQRTTITNDALDSFAICGACPTSGTFVPTSGTALNLNSVNILTAHYINVGNEVTVTGRVSWQSVTTAGSLASLTLSLPIPTTLDVATTYGTIVWNQTGVGAAAPQPKAFVGTSANVVQIEFTPATIKSGSFVYTYVYTLAPIQ